MKFFCWLLGVGVMSFVVGGLAGVPGLLLVGVAVASGGAMEGGCVVTMEVVKAVCGVGLSLSSRMYVLNRVVITPTKTPTNRGRKNSLVNQWGVR